MKLGICLTGGGAKGAFEAGIISVLSQNGIFPEILTGTSIGAVNAYFWMRDGIREMEEFWVSAGEGRGNPKIDKTVDNSELIKRLYPLNGWCSHISNVFVNYVHVENSMLSEVVEDIRNMERDRALDAVKYSSLLPARPYNPEEEFDSKRVFENFREDVQNGVYEGFNLDGGILNNSLLSPFISNRVNKVLIIGLWHTYTAPEYIYDYYDRQNVIVLRPDIVITPGDTLRFEGSYCRDMYQRGRNAACGVLEILK